jgi:hypothetical protein
MAKSEMLQNAAGAGEADQRLLQVFVGTWNTEGRAHDSPFGRAAAIRATESYEWLPGERFLVHFLQGRLGDDEMACIEMLGYDAASGSCLVHSFYNDGNRNVLQATEQDGTWTFTGAWKKEDETLKLRCTSRFGADGDSVDSVWEYSRGGARWERFWETKATRA